MEIYSALSGVGLEAIIIYLCADVLLSGSPSFTFLWGNEETQFSASKIFISSVLNSLTCRFFFMLLTNGGLILTFGKISMPVTFFKKIIKVPTKVEEK